MAKKINFSELPDIFRNVFMAQSSMSSNYSNYRFEVTEGSEVVANIYITDGTAIGTSVKFGRDYFTSIPFETFEQFRQDAERSGISLKYRSDEESE